MTEETGKESTLKAFASRAKKSYKKKSSNFISQLTDYGAATEELQIFAKPKKVHPWMAQNVDPENGVSMATVNQCPKGECPRMA